MVRFWLSLTLLSTLILSAGCSTLSVVPLASPGTEIDPKSNAISSRSGDLTVTVKLQDLEFGPYTGGERNITSFYVVVVNHGASEVRLPLENFVLLDEEKNQYRAMDPAVVISMTKRTADYLIPYPYVGYYYLQDNVEYAFKAETASSFPYTTTERVIDVQAEALPNDAIIPGARLTGMVYFNVDLYQKKSIELKVRLPATDFQNGLSFPFQIVK